MVIGLKNNKTAMIFGEEIIKAIKESVNGTARFIKGEKKST